jgi:hypothetical protein
LLSFFFRPLLTDNLLAKRQRAAYGGTSIQEDLPAPQAVLAIPAFWGDGAWAGVGGSRHEYETPHVRRVTQDQRGARRRHAWVVFLDESGISLTPVVHRTWAPRGQMRAWIRAAWWLPYAFARCCGIWFW